MSTNLATEYLRARNERPEDWEGVCGELADRIAGPNDDIFYVEGAPIRENSLYGKRLRRDFLNPAGRHNLWKYHMVMVRDGLVHDAWCEGEVLTVREWLIRSFGGATEVEVSRNGKTIFTGACENYEIPVRH